MSAGRKVGADDYLVKCGVDALRALLDRAEPLCKQERTDIGNAQRLAARAAGVFLYVPKFKRWLQYDGRRWAADGSERVRELAVTVATEMLIEAATTPEDERKAITQHAFKSQSKERISAMLALAPDAAPALKTDPADLDGDPWLLNVANGTLDLRTGILRPHDPADLISQLAPVEYDPKAASALWNKTLREILPDTATREFLQRWFGYCLTGSVREEKLAFLQGSGRNGKGTLIETVLAVLGDYGCTAAESLLLARKQDTHPTEMADLRGKRVVVANEIGEGRSWNTPRVKMLTGGDRVKARRMREDFFEFNPTHKIVVLSNPRPRADAEDQALWARLKLVPFEQEFRDAPDLRLKEKLLRELPAVLRWMVDGCLAWQRDGLGEPSKVREATAEYQSELRALDPVERFLAGRELTLQPRTPLKELTALYNATSDRKLTARELATRLRARGYEVKVGTGNKTVVSPPPPDPAPRLSVVK